MAMQPVELKAARARRPLARRAPRVGIAAAWRSGSACLAALAALAAPAQEAATAAENAAVQAAAQRVGATEYVEAINAVEAVIEAIEQRSSRYDLALVRPLVVLGDALAGVGDTDGAFGSYDRALHIARVNLGLHHPSQVHVVYRQAALLAKLGNRRTANARHEYAYDVLLRSYGGDSPQLLPGLFALADWYLSNYSIFNARILYEHAADVAGEHLPPDHGARIRALRSVAATYRDERFPPFYTRDGRAQGNSVGSYAGFQYRRSPYSPSVNSFSKGERALIEVVNILQAKGAPDDTVAAAMLDLGDWFLMFDKQRRAVALYRRAWELLAERPALQAKVFAAPTPLYLPLPENPPKPEHALEQSALDGLVELSVDIDERGLVSSIDTLRSEPKDLMDFKVRRAARRARYRPAFDGTEPQATEDVRITHAFVYYPAHRAMQTSSSAARAVETSVADAGLSGNRLREEIQ